MRKLGFLAVLLGVFGILLAGVLTAVNQIGTASGLYYQLQMRAGVLSYAGVSEQDLVLLDVGLSECLKGRPETIKRLHVNVNGRVQRAFNERELTHMEDCRALFELLRRVLLICVIAGPLLLAAGLFALRDRGKARLAAWLAPLLILLPLGALAVWAVIDFDAAFTFFHQVLFTNDLWLLDPRTDLLIRICPQSMFVSMGARIGILSLLWLMLVPLLFTLLSLIGGKKSRKRGKKRVYELQIDDGGEG